MAIKFDNPASLAAPGGAYSHVATVPAGAALVFVSGQVPIAQDGSTATTLAEQADLVYANIVAALAAQGLLPASIVKLTTFMVDDDPAMAAPRARAKHLGAHRPASTLVWVRRLADPAWKIEVEAVAASE